MVESRGETQVKREYINGGEKEGSAQEKLDAHQYRGFRGTERNRAEPNGTLHTLKRHQATGTEVSRGGPVGFSCSVRVPRSARASFFISFTRSFYLGQVHVEHVASSPKNYISLESYSYFFICNENWISFTNTRDEKIA